MTERTKRALLNWEGCRFALAVFREDCLIKHRKYLHLRRWMYRRLRKMGQKVFHASSSSSSSSKIQALYELCKQNFTPSGTPPPSPEVIQKLRSLMDTITPADVGLTEDIRDDGHGSFGLNQFNRAGPWVKPITYLDIHECDSFTMCVFCFPTSSVIPLHDHPGMTVLSKVLYGSLHVKAYDWVEPAQIQRSTAPSNSPVRLAKLAADKVVTAPCETQVLYPKIGGNLHCFTAVAPCAVLDVLTPPYNNAAGRTCTYYHDYPYSGFSVGNEDEPRDGNEEEYAWLAPLPGPKDFYTIPRKYRGPAIEV
ncbi:plant cysteine oxidase 3 isoform X2 [Diospyros lotus]|uniref:plant cysteine oxidase 3 isoform X2 n=1 Tax=Diospyros lotus TaxID=55363 RepID=UPI00225ADEFC|nr:plant cysteine oxidase 3 isoform X2 [Diospyros lotus]